MPNLPSGTVTFLFTDIEGSTKLWEQQPAAMKAALAKHDSILKEAVTANQGQIIKTTGDGVHAVFTTALDGITAAIKAQRELDQTTDSLRLRVRMGLHTGEAELREGDYYGSSLNRAARIMSIGHGGQVLLSETTAQVVGEHLAADLQLRDLGNHHLKGLLRPERIFQLVIPDLQIEFPPLNSIATATNNLPTQLTSFIGREKVIGEIRASLKASRLVTLTGSGGTGKTRLSIEVGTQELEHFADGVWMIELAPLSDPAQIVPALAQIFGLREAPFAPLAALVTDYLRAKKPLLILDNCEHLIAACARLANDLLHQCPELTILASSREALGIAGEMAYRTPSLAEAESSRLFVERAQAANSKFARTESNASSITQICARLDGIPLALELAAARTKLLSADQIATRLDDRFKLLTGGSRTALPRQQTLRALIDWSYDLLSEEERMLLRRLSVFAGGWTFEAAEFVCPNLDVLELLSQLVNKSLVVVDDELGESARYHLLETIRQYARDKLLDANEAAEARNSHAQYFSQMAITAEPELYKAESAKAVNRLDDDWDNLRAALEWATGQDIETALRMVCALQLFWIRNGYQSQGRTQANAVIANAEALPPLEGEAAARRNYLIARALGAVVAVAMSHGDNRFAAEASAKSAVYARAIGDNALVARALGFSCAGRLAVGDTSNVEAQVQEALECARASDDIFALGLSLGVNAEYLMITGKNPELAREYTSQSTKILTEHDNQWGYTIVLIGIGLAAKYKGDYKFARETFDSILPLCRAMQDHQRATMILSEYGHMDRYEGRIDEAERAYLETIPIWRKLGHRAAVANQLECLAFIAIAHEQGERAAKLLGAAEALREKIQIPMGPFERVEYDQHVAALRKGMDEADFKKAWAGEGRALTMEQAVEFALQKA